MDGTYPIIESLNTAKSLLLSQLKEYSSFLTAFGLEHHLFPAFRLELRQWLFLVLSLPAFQLKHQHSWAARLPTHPADLGTYGLHNHVSQFLIVNLYHIGSIFLENPD